MNTKKLFEHYLDTIYVKVDYFTYKNYKSITKTALRHLPKETEEISKKHIYTFLEEITQRYKAGYARKIIINAKVAFEIAFEDQLICQNPFEKIEPTKEEISTISPFCDDEIKIVLSGATGALKDYLGVAFFTGMRGGEILALTWDDIDFEKKTISVTKSVSNGLLKNNTKTGVDRVVPLFAKAEYFFRQLEAKRVSKWVFNRQNKDHYFGTTVFARSWSKLLLDSNIKYRSLRHTRHTFATNLVEKALKKDSDIKLVSVAKILGHSMQTLLRYYVRPIGNEHLMIDREILE
ncbi:site-specific recombinase, phage integrase family [Campylobacter iguaniorum]|uniref:tyrosine-type recombinase/integrase n=1 Tax=Campylobacter iguaniorum TaxID=1244531 RepID=UPI00073A39E2|nr:site-specific integrase [Campylobacter iguaniorum]ALV24921.1 site-specific recombinase, phage integrase family [Campylobacter iguaniorum]